MSITTHPPTKREPTDNDPFRLGRRYLRHTLADGTEWVEQVPLTERDLLFPHEGDEVMHIDAHSRVLFYMYMILCHHLRDRADAKVLFDHRVDFGIEDVEPLGPDLSVFFDLPDWDILKGTLNVAEWGASPQLVIEATSPDSRRNDLELKVDFYERGGVAYYAVIDLHAGENGERVKLTGYRLTAVGYALDEPNENGWLWLEPVGLWLGLEGVWAVLYDAKGKRLGNYDEAVEAAQEALKQYLEEKEAREHLERDARELVAARRLAEQVARAQTAARELAEKLAREDRAARELAEQVALDARTAQELAEKETREQTAARESDQREISDLRSAKILAEQRAKSEAELRLAVEARLRELEAELGRRSPPTDGNN